MTATRYILRTNGIDDSATYTSKNKAIAEAQAYVGAAERMERDATEHTHVIQIRTQLSGKIVFDQTVVVPALPSKSLTDVTPHTGTQVCGHCWKTAQWQFKTEGMTDFECTQHAMEWWPEETQAYADSTLTAVEPQAATQPLSGLAEDWQAAMTGKPQPRTGVIAPTLSAQAPSQTLDTAKSYSGTELCGWCGETATTTIQVAGQSHPEFACPTHMAEYFPYLNNTQHLSALCPNITHGCEHTMAMNDDGYAVACVEYANSLGIDWKDSERIPVSLVKEYGLPYAYIGEAVNLYHLGLWGHQDGFRRNDLVTLGSFFAIMSNR